MEVKVPLYAVKGTALPLFAVNDSRKSDKKSNWSDIKTVLCVHHASGETLDALLKRRTNVFNKGLGMLNGFKATLTLKPRRQPTFFHACVVP